MMNRSYASVKKPMPEMNMTFQCCFVILESSIRERMSVCFIVASDIGGVPLGDAQVRARHYPRADLDPQFLCHKNFVVRLGALRGNCEFQ